MRDVGYAPGRGLLMLMMGVGLVAAGCSGESGGVPTASPGLNETASPPVDPTDTPAPTATQSGEATATAAPGDTPTDGPQPSDPPDDTPTDPPQPSDPPDDTPTDGPQPSDPPGDTPTDGPQPSDPPDDTPTDAPQPSDPPADTPTDPPQPTDPPDATPTDGPEPTLPPGETPTDAPEPTDPPQDTPTATPATPTPTQAPTPTATAPTDADGDGYIAAVDCNDSDMGIHPGADEVCDSVDQDCDVAVDEGVKSTFYIDGDDDTYGTGSPVEACEAPDGYVGRAGDCDDDNNAVNPDATEVCNDIDDDCSGTTDVGAVDASTWYADDDRDTYGDIGDSTQACEAPSGTVADSSDCNDDDGDIYPGAQEIPNDGVDQDCDGEDQTATDLNQDGYPDLVVSNNRNGDDYTRDSWILYGSAAGLDVDNRVDLPTLGAIGSCIADFDGDGWLDVVFANYRDASSNYNVDSYLYWGGPDGFDADDRTDLPTLGSQRCVAADLDGDGDADLAFSNYRDNSSYVVPSYVYWNDEGSFTRANRDSLTTNGALAVVARDLNGDGEMELIFSGNYNGSSYNTDSKIFWGQDADYDDSRVTLLPSLGNQTPVQVADLDGDEALDIVVCNYRNGSDYTINSYVYYGPDFSTGDRQSLPTRGCLDSRVSDFDQDGYVDIAFANYYDGDDSVQSYVYYGSSRGYSEDNRQSLSNNRSRRMEVADLDGDGYEEIVLATYFDGDYNTNSRIFWGSSRGYSDDARSNLASKGAQDVVVVDIDQDSYPDVVFANHREGASDTTDHNVQSYVYYGSSRGIFENHRSTFATQGAYHVSANDLDGDGNEDLVFSGFARAASTFDTQSVIAFGSPIGPRHADMQTVPTFGSRHHCVGDINGDGFMDIVFANERNGDDRTINSFVYWGSAAGYAEDNREELPTIGAYHCSLADLDGDDDLDIVFSNYRNGSDYTVESYVYYYDSNLGVFPLAARLGLPTEGAVASTVTDLNGDGYLDIVFAGYYDGSSYAAEAYIYWGNEDGTYSSARRLGLPVSGCFSEPRVADVDGNGYMDILFAGYYDGNDNVTSYLYYGSAAGYSEGDRASFALNRSVDSAIADLDQDGALDLVFSTYYDGNDSVNNYVYWGTRDGFSDNDRTTLGTKRVVGVEVEDIDGDGWSDLVFAGYYDGDYNTVSYVFYGSPTGLSAERVLTLRTDGGRQSAIADFDQDGYKDIAFSNYRSGDDYTRDSWLYWGSPRGMTDSLRREFQTFGAANIGVAGQ